MPLNSAKSVVYKNNPLSSPAHVLPAEPPPSEQAHNWSLNGSSIKDLQDQVNFLNKEIEALTYSISHDLKTPLRGIAGLSKALVEDYSQQLDEEGQDFLNRINNRALLMGKLIDNILKLSRLSRKELRPERVNLSELCRQTTYKLLEKHPQLSIDLKIQEDIFAYGDPDLLILLLEGVLESSINSIQKSSHPLAGRLRFEQKTINRLPTYVLFNNGQGFDQSQRDRVFEALPFDPQSNGEDLPQVSLAIAQRIVHRHQGTIYLNPKPKIASTFFFTLFPLTTSEAHLQESLI